MIVVRVVWAVHWNTTPPTYVISIPHGSGSTKITLEIPGGPFSNPQRASDAAYAHLSGLSDDALATLVRHQSRRAFQDN